MPKDKFNIFVYGSLRDKQIFKSVCGISFTTRAAQVKQGTLFAEPALLAGYKRFSPDNVYYYAVKSPASIIHGMVIYDLHSQVLDEIDKYEGKRYKRQTVRVHTATGAISAQAYLVSRKLMQQRFGDRWHVNLIHELWLRKRIEKFLKKRTRPGDASKDAELERITDRELLAAVERDLVISHYRSDAVSDYFLERELDRPRPSIKHLYNDPQAKPFIKNYLTLVIRQVLLSQLDEKIQAKYRFELEHIRTSERYFKRTVSLLTALRIINENSLAVDRIVKNGLTTIPYKSNDLFDFVKYAAGAAKDLFDRRITLAQLDYIRAHFSPGITPLGAELEFSNLGPAAVEPLRSIQKKIDPVYDGFKYFYDFLLDVLSWKLGGYIDDHSGSTDKGRRCGFLELAPGRLSIEGELSRPATADPWTLGQLINEIVKFYNVKPHSLHLSFQMRKNQVGHQKLLPLEFVKCLLALGGGPEQKKTGGIRISRIAGDEIKQYSPDEELIFARTSRRKWFIGQDSMPEKLPAQVTSYVQQYKFIRLDKKANYETLIMCLKGLQLAYNPADYLTAEQLKDPKIWEDYQQLKLWALEPSPIAPKSIRQFLETVRTGLMNEGHRQPIHKLHYIDWALSAIDYQLRSFNKTLISS